MHLILIIVLALFIFRIISGFIDAMFAIFTDDKTYTVRIDGEEYQLTGKQYDKYRKEHAKSRQASQPRTVTNPYVVQR